MTVALSGGTSFLDTVGNDSFFADDNSTLASLVVSTTKTADADFKRAVKLIEKVDMNKTRTAPVDKPEGVNVRFMIKATKKKTKYEAVKKTNYITYLGKEEPHGLTVGSCTFATQASFNPFDDDTRAYLLTEEGKQSRLYALIQMQYALYGDWKTAVEEDDLEALASHPNLITASPHFATSKLISDEVKKYVVLSKVPDYGPPQKDGKKLPAIPPAKFNEFYAKAVLDEQLIAELCLLIYLNNTMQVDVVLNPGDSISLGYPGDFEKKSKAPRTPPKICKCIASGYVGKTCLISPKSKWNSKLKKFVESPGLSTSHFWAHDDITMYKILLEIPPKVVFNYRIDKRDFSHSLSSVGKYDSLYTVVLPQRARACMTWAKMFSYRLQGKDDISQISERQNMTVGFATFGPYIDNESNFRREIYVAASGGTTAADRERIKRNKEFAKNVGVVGSGVVLAKPDAAGKAGNDAAAVAAPPEKKEEKKKEEGVYFDWFLMHLEIQMGPILHDVSETDLIDVNTNVFSSFLHVHFQNSVLRQFGIGQNDVAAARSIIQQLLYSTNFGIDSRIETWDTALAKSAKMCDAIIGKHLQPAHMSEWEKLISELKAAHTGIPQLAQHGIYRVNRVENKDRIAKFLKLAFDFNRAYKVTRLENIEEIDVDVASAIETTGWKVSKKTAVHLEESISEMLKIENSPVAGFRFGVGVQLPDGIKLINSSFQEGVSTASGISEDKFDFYVVGFERPFRSRTNNVVPFTVEETDAVFCNEYYEACKMGTDDKQAYLDEVKKKYPSSTIKNLAPDLSDGPATSLFALYAIPKTRNATFSYEKFADLITDKKLAIKNEPETAPATAAATSSAQENENANPNKRKRDDISEDVKQEESHTDAAEFADVEMGEPIAKHPKIEELPDDGNADFPQDTEMFD